MHRTPVRGLLPAVLAAAVSAVQAQNPPAAAVPSDPLDAGAAVPAFVHRSTLSTYRRLVDGQPLPWPQANQTVGRIGGWRAYAREAGEPGATAGPAASAPSGPATASQGGDPVQ